MGRTRLQAGHPRTESERSVFRPRCQTSRSRNAADLSTVLKLSKSHSIYLNRSRAQLLKDRKRLQRMRDELLAWYEFEVEMMRRLSWEALLYKRGILRMLLRKTVDWEARYEVGFGLRPVWPALTKAVHSGSTCCRWRAQLALRQCRRHVRLRSGENWTSDRSRSTTLFTFQYDRAGAGRLHFTRGQQVGRLLPRPRAPQRQSDESVLEDHGHPQLHTQAGPVSLRQRSARSGFASQCRSEQRERDSSCVEAEGQGQGKSADPVRKIECAICTATK